MQATEYAANANHSFALPDICVRIRKMLDDNSSDTSDIGAVVSLDPSLSSKLLRLANSPLFRFRSEIDSLPKAVSVIGGEALYNLVMAETASSAFEHFAEDDFDLKRFWYQSIYTGLIGKHLARLARVRGSDKFFLLGLLHNLGELVVLSQTPELAKEAGEFHQNESPWVRQKRVLGFTFSQCSGELMQLWKLPQQLSEPVLTMHDESRATAKKDLAILYTAARAGLAMASNGEYTVDDLYNPVVHESTGLAFEDVLDAISYTKMEAIKVLSVMNPRMA